MIIRCNLDSLLDFNILEFQNILVALKLKNVSKINIVLYKKTHKEELVITKFEDTIKDFLPSANLELLEYHYLYPSLTKIMDILLEKVKVNKYKYSCSFNNTFKYIGLNTKEIFDKGDISLNDYFERDIKMDITKFNLICAENNIPIINASGKPSLDIFNVILDVVLKTDLIIGSEYNIAGDAYEIVLRKLLNLTDPKYLHLGTYLSSQKNELLTIQDFLNQTFVERFPMKFKKIVSDSSKLIKYTNLIYSNCFNQKDIEFEFDKPVFKRTVLDYRSCI